MRKVRIQAIWLLFISCFPPLQAQWDAPVTRYWTVKGHYNPAFTGGDETIELSALYRFQWAGIQHAPQRVIFSAHQSFHFLNRQHGAGVTGYRNMAGSLRNDLLAAQYSYILPTHSGNIHFGLQAGMLNLAFNEGGAHIGGGIAEGSQPSFNAEEVQGQLADLNAGIAWQGDNGYAGLSFLHLNEPGFRILNDTLDQQSDSLQLFIPCTIQYPAISFVSYRTDGMVTDRQGHHAVAGNAPYGNRTLLRWSLMAFSRRVQSLRRYHHRRL